MALEWEYPCVIIGLDSGATSGVSAVGVVNPDTLPEHIFHDQWGDQDKVWKKLLKLVRKYQKKFKVYLVIEQFDARPGIVNPDYSAKYINRDIENNFTDVDIFWQIPATAMTLVPNGKQGKTDALPRFGWQVTPKTVNRHTNDAMRHIIVFLVSQMRHMPTILKGWPKQ